MELKPVLLSAAAMVLSQWTLLAQGFEFPQYRQQPPFDLKAALGTTGDWTAVVTAAIEPARELANDAGPSQSRICFVRATPQTNECAYFQELFHSNLTLQVFTSLAVEPLRSGSAPASGLVLKAAALYPTGQLPETAVWVYDPRQDRFHLVSAVESGEVRVFSSGPLNGTLVTADWHREEGDTRWSDHRRDISVYRYTSEAGGAGYQKVFQYTTTSKYGAEDTSTIDAELPNIEAKMP
jgi:hypothetical protein